MEKSAFAGAGAGLRDEGDLLSLILDLYSAFLGLASGERLNGCWRMVVVIRVGLLQLPMLLQLLLLEHLCDLVEQLLYVLSSLGRDSEVGHFIFLDEILEPLLLECSEWAMDYLSRSLLLPQMMEIALSFLFSRNRLIHPSMLESVEVSSWSEHYSRRQRQVRSRLHL